jgi:arylsulfatase A-like enzyme
LLYESQLRVPLIIYSPSRTFLHRRVEQMRPLLDLAPTILDLAGLPRPEAMQGQSLVPLMNEHTARVASPAFVVAETHFRNYDKMALYTQEWAYFDHRDGGIPQGLNRHELQVRGTPQRGRFTDTAAINTETRGELAQLLAEWEAAHPPMPAAAMQGTLSDEERIHLEAIGYLE